MDTPDAYNVIPFAPAGMSPEALQAGCLAARRRFYALPSIARRAFARSNRTSAFMWRNYFLINGMLRAEVAERDHYPLGDERDQSPLLEA